MANYKVGDLDVTISGVSKDAVDSFDAVISKLKNMQQQLGVVSKSISTALNVDTSGILKSVDETAETVIGLNSEIEAAQEKVTKLNDTLSGISKTNLADKVNTTFDNTLSGRIEEYQTKIANLAETIAQTKLEKVQFPTEEAFNGLNDTQKLELYKQKLIELDKIKRQSAMTTHEIALANFEEERALVRTELQYYRLQIAEGNLTDGTIKYRDEVRKLIKKLDELDKKAGKVHKGSFSKLIKQVGKIAFYRTIRRGLQMITQTFSETIQAYAQVDDNINDMMSQLTSSTKIIELSAGTIILPILQVITPMVQELSEGFAEIANTINMAMANMQGLSTYTKINTDAIKDYRKQLNKTNNALFDFDKFRALSSNKQDNSVFFEQAEITEEDKRNEKLRETENILGSISTVLQDAWVIVKSLWDALAPILGVVVNVLATLLPTISSIISMLADLLLPYLENIGVWIDTLGKLLEPILRTIEEALRFLVDFLNGDLETAFTGFANMVIGLINTVIAAIESVVNIAIKTINSLITGINMIYTWVPGLKKKGIPEIPLVSWGRVSYYAMGASDIDSGSLFVAGEAGKTEMVYTGDNGKTNVANVQQMAQADYQGTIAALNEWWKTARNDIPQLERASDTGIYQAASRGARKSGKTFMNV